MPVPLEGQLRKLYKQWGATASNAHKQKRIISEQIHAVKMKIEKKQRKQKIASAPLAPLRLPYRRWKRGVLSPQQDSHRPASASEHAT